MLNSYSILTLNAIAVIITLVFASAIIWIAVLYFIDIKQNKQAIRRNYPVIGRFRYFFEHMGTFFRQYFFAMDREEMPFNRALRNWVYRACKNVDTTLAFGSTRDLRANGEPIFMNAMFPILEEQAQPSPTLTIGESCPTPYDAPSFFNISGMSYGAISKVAIRALSQGAHSSGCWINTGEGGLTPFHLESGADIVFQIGTAKYGVRDEAGNLCPTRLKAISRHKPIKMFEIKLSQGAKPGKGGMLPAAKVTAEVASIRGITEGKDSISPNRHIDIYDNASLLDFIDRVRTITGKPVGIKAVLGDPAWLTAFLDEINRRGSQSAPDFFTLDCAEGGTGAAPQPLMDYLGLPLRESLPILTNALIKAQLRDRIKVIASGKLVAPGPVAVALANGADFIVSARGFMFALGCIQALQCNKNNCPTGITTHDKTLQKGLDPHVKSERVANYHKQMIKEVEMIAHSCGVSSARELNTTHVRIVTQNNVSAPIKSFL